MDNSETTTQTSPPVERPRRKYTRRTTVDAESKTPPAAPVKRGRKSLEKENAEQKKLDQLIAESNAEYEKGEWSKSKVKAARKEARAARKAEKVASAYKNGKLSAPRATRAPYKPRAKKAEPTWQQQLKKRIGELTAGRKPVRSRSGWKAKKQAKGTKPARRVKGSPSPIFSGLSNLLSVILDRKLPKGVSWPGVAVFVMGMGNCAALIMLLAYLLRTVR